MISMTPTLIHHPCGLYFFLCTFEQRHIPRDAGFQWHNDYKKWYTKHFTIAEKLKTYAEPKLKEQLEKAQSQIEKSSAASSLIYVPLPNGKQLRSYQKAGVEWCLSRKVSLIGDEPGLGKTIQAIGVMNCLNPARTLVLCPSIVKLNWGEEIRAWGVGSHDIDIVYGTKHIISKEAKVVICNYDLLVYEDIHVQMRGMDIDLLIADESHVLKNDKAKRTLSVLNRENGIAHRAKKVILMTGTPILNRPIELYPTLKALSPQTIAPYSDKFSYGRRFCNLHETRFGWDFSGASNLDDLSRRLRSTLMIRRLKKDVLQELPAKTHQIICFEPDKKTSKLVKKDQEILKSEIRKKKFSQSADNEKSFMAERQEMALAKMDVAIDHIENTLESVDKLVIFAYHRSVIQALETRLKDYGVAVIQGGVSPEKRQKVKDAFQHGKSTRILIGQIEAAGVGITLTAAHNIIFVEFPWNPGLLDQCIDRCHRMGQKEAVNAQFLCVKGSIDEHMLRLIYDKEETLDKTLNRQEAFLDL